MCDTRLGMHYSPPLIKRELETLLGGTGASFPHWVCRDGERTIFTAKTRHPFAADDKPAYDKMMEAASRSGTSALEEAEAFLVTYGLSDLTEEFGGTEWISLDRLPPLGANTGVLRSRQMRASEVAAVTADIVDLIRSRKPGAPIVFSVSPIPLKATYSGKDIHIADCLSKSTLIAGVNEYFGQLGESDRRVFYFPAYEMFISQRHPFEVWQPDGRHPTARMISHVCKVFATTFRLSNAEFNEIVDFVVPKVNATGQRVT